MGDLRSSNRDPTLPANVITINEACYRQLYRLEKKLYRHQSHYSFLNTCLRNNLIPKGLTIKTAPTIENTGLGRSVWIEWKRILCRTSTLLMQVLKRHHLLITNHLQGEMERLEQSLSQRSDFNTAKTVISLATTRVAKELEECKQRKFDHLFRSCPTPATKCPVYRDVHISIISASPH